MQHWYVTKFQATLIASKGHKIKVWVLLGTSLPKVNTMSIFCDVMSKNGRQQRTVQRKANIHDLANCYGSMDTV